MVLPLETRQKGKSFSIEGEKNNLHSVDKPGFRVRAKSGNQDRRPFLDQIEKLDDVLWRHANATVRTWSAQLVNVVRPVDVDIAIPRVGIFRIKSLKAQNARHDDIGFIWESILRPKAARNSTAENDRGRKSIAYFLRNTKSARWRLVGTFLETGS